MKPDPHLTDKCRTNRHSHTLITKRSKRKSDRHTGNVGGGGGLETGAAGVAVHFPFHEERDLQRNVRVYQRAARDGQRRQQAKRH